MPRSERGRIRGNCLHGIALPSLAQAPAAGGAPAAGRASAAGGAPGAGRAPGVGRLIGPERRRTGLDFQAAAGRVGRAVESRQRGSEDRGEGMGERQGRAGRRSGPGRQRASWGLGGPRGPSSQARAHGGGRRKNPIAFYGGLGTKSALPGVTSRGTGLHSVVILRADVGGRHSNSAAAVIAVWRSTESTLSQRSATRIPKQKMASRPRPRSFYDKLKRSWGGPRTREVWRYSGPSPCSQTVNKSSDRRHLPQSHRFNVNLRQRVIPRK